MTAVDVTIARGEKRPAAARSVPVVVRRASPPDQPTTVADAQAIAPPDDDVQREILRLELEAHISNLQAEADSILSDALVEGRVADLPEGLRPLAAAEAGAETPEETADAMVEAAMATPEAHRHGRHAPPTADAADPTEADQPSLTGPRRYPAAMPDRLPPPGPSFLREQPIRLADRTLSAGMSRPSEAPDGWWLAVVWVTDEAGVVSFRDVAPAAGPPPDPPLARLGPAVSGALSGLILEDARPAPDAPRADRPAGRRDPAVARPAGDPRRLPVRARAGRHDAPERARGDGPRRRSVGPSKGSTGPERPGRVDSPPDARPVRRLHGGAPQARGDRAWAGSGRGRPATRGPRMAR